MFAIIPTDNGESSYGESEGHPEEHLPGKSSFPPTPYGSGPGGPLLTTLVTRFPRLRRQLHPLIIHFPITFLLSATGFSLLYLATRIKSFQTTAWHCLGGGVLFLPPAMWSGILTEKLNYPDPPRNARLERMLSPLLIALGLAAFIWGLADPDILDHLGGWNLIYLFLLLALPPLVVAAGFIGGMLTFPLEDAEQPPAKAGNAEE
jgi:uncharacterized membrane protein